MKSAGESERRFRRLSLRPLENAACDNVGNSGLRVFTMEIFTSAVHDAELRRGWQQFYDSVREFYLGLLRAAAVAGAVYVADPEQAVNLMLAAMEGIKLRALFEPEICSSMEEERLVEGLKEILGFPAATPNRSR